MTFGRPLWWRETHRQPRFLIFDGRLVILILAVLMHIRLWTIVVIILVMLSLLMLERRGVPADSILRYLRSSIVGRKRSARGFGSERLPVDFGFETKALVAREAAAVEAFQKARLQRREKEMARRKQGGLRVA